jgi:hypothetical protein
MNRWPCRLRSHLTGLFTAFEHWGQGGKGHQREERGGLGRAAVGSHLGAGDRASLKDPSRRRVGR